MGGVALVASVGFAQVKQTPRGYTLQAAYRSKVVLKFEASTAIGGVTQDNRAVALTFPITMRVMAVRHGISTIRFDFGNPESMHQPLPLSMTSAVVKLDRHNKPVGSNRSAQVVAMFPDHPVQLGEKWSGVTTIPLNSGSAGALVATDYKLNRIALDHGRHIAELSLTMRGLATGEGTVLINAGDGSVLSSVLNLKLRNAGKTYPVQLIVRRL